MDVSSVKAEIKAWERQFRSTNARDPTVDDIKQEHLIADKYKLYKKLAKAAASSAPPSTPSRSHASLLPNSRTVQATAPLSSFNPFSPQKNKVKPLVKPLPKPSTSSNPFPLLLQPSTSALTPTQSPPAATSALSRARKRLRGEPVSPSPNKGKRRRVGSQTILPFPRLTTDPSSSEDEDDNPDSSFVSDSPVKAPAGGKSFKLLFEDNAGAAPSKGKSTKSSRGLFGDRTQHEDVSWDIANTEPTKTKVTLFKSTHISKAKNSIFPRETKKSAKRSISDTEMESTTAPQEAPKAGPSLLPPSPPPANSARRSNQFSNARGKAKAKSSGRKKAKTTDDDLPDEDEDEEETSHTTVKIFDRAQSVRLQRSTSVGHEDTSLDFDPDPVLGYSQRAAPHGREPSPPPGEQLEGRFDVDLPDRLRRVLALESVEARARDSREERVVKGLVLGRRETHYDPTKGGEIWDAGEDDVRLDGEEQVKRDSEGEDDWEGEPVPWEVGEL